MIDRESTMEECGLDPSDPDAVSRFNQDQTGCNCDIDYQCFNVDCRERYEKERAYWASYWAPAMIETYRPEYDANYDHSQCGLMCQHSNSRP